MTSNQPQYIRNVAIIGGTGNVGSHFIKHILAAGKHSVTALTRADSKAVFPDGVTVVKVDYNSEDSLVDALRGQDFLSVSLSTSTPPDVHRRVVSAAAKAGVPYVMPNYYAFGLGERSGSLGSDPILSTFSTFVEDVRSTDGISFIALTCGFWYEFSLSLGDPWYGFDIKNRKVTFYDDGKTRINTSTWEQCGRALAALLQLPLKSEDGQPAVEDWKDDALYISSFLISQRDMLDSLHRVLGTSDEDWTISYQDVKERQKAGMEELQAGKRTGFAKAMYARIFFPGTGGDYETGYQLDNAKLGLPKEDLDEATKLAVKMANEGVTY